jgi:tetratricopeptide (TPR) repeat protein
MRGLPFLALVLAILLGACTPTYFITIHTEYPPKVNIPAHIKNIAVLEFGGQPEGAEYIRSKLEEQLMRDEHYKVIARSEIGALMNERAFAETGLVEESVRNQLKLKRVDAIITGTVTMFDCKPEQGTDIEERPRRVYRGERPKYDSKGRFLRMEAVYDTVYDKVPVHWIARHANVMATFTMIDMDGQKIDTVSEPGSFSTGKVKGDAMPVPEAECKDRAVRICIETFIKDISVYTDDKPFRLESGPDIAAANKMAATGLYSDAEGIYSNAFASNRENWAAAYNLGLVLEAQAKYEEAEAVYRNAMQASGGRGECMAAVKRAGEKKALSSRLKGLKKERGE